MLHNHFLGKGWDEKILVQKCFGRKFFVVEIFLLQNHFLGNSLDEKKFGQNIFWSKIFLVDNFVVVITSQL